jgi:hypothetical protein
MRSTTLVFCCLQAAASAQEANSGFALRSTLSGITDYTHELTESPRDGSSVAGGVRLMLYPMWKLSSHWSFSGAIQFHSRPYFNEEYSTQGYGLKADVLQAGLTYTQFWRDRSLVIRVGQLSSTFGSFLLRYDDAGNALIDMPLSYGYYQKGVSNLGLLGAEVDATAGKLDARLQFTNSSPANPRSIFDHDQYGDWAGGIGYTIVQGFRVGVSAYRGPYLDRHSQFYFPGEAPPHDLPGIALGLDIQWGRGPWNVYGELQKFHNNYRLIRTFKEDTGYGELRRVLAPRWYVATRIGYIRANVFPWTNSIETVVGFRPNRYQLIKLGYEIHHGPTIRGTLDNTLALQLVTTFPLS